MSSLAQALRLRAEACNAIFWFVFSVALGVAVVLVQSLLCFFFRGHDLEQLRRPRKGKATSANSKLENVIGTLEGQTIAESYQVNTSWSTPPRQHQSLAGTDAPESEADLTGLQPGAAPAADSTEVPVTPKASGVPVVQDTPRTQDSMGSSCTFSPCLPLPSASLLSHDTRCLNDDAPTPQSRLFTTITTTADVGLQQEGRSESERDPRHHGLARQPLLSSSAANTACTPLQQRQQQPQVANRVTGVFQDCSNTAADASALKSSCIKPRLAPSPGKTPKEPGCAGASTRATPSTAGRPSICGGNSGNKGSASRPRYLKSTQSSWAKKQS